MKTLITFILSAFVVTISIAQEKNIETKSVELGDLISFIVDNYNLDSESQNITFLIQVNNDEFSGEYLILLKQGFKLISERLDEDSKVTIVAYSKFNGIALNSTPANEVKLILHTLSDLKGSISEFYNDGISLAYKTAEDNYNEELDNSVVMIRIDQKAQNEIVNIEEEEKKIKNKKKTNALLVAALTLLPEVINLIKN
jgi:hypothetical protein